MIGRGHATAFIAALLQTLFDQGALVVATDPHPECTRDSRYQKPGLERSGPSRETGWGLILTMLSKR